MKAFKIQIALLLSLAILFQAGTSLGHIFVHHHEHSCLDHGQGHFHSQKTDCHFSLFFRTISFFDEPDSFEWPVFASFNERPQYYYNPFSQKSVLVNFLRGPPAMA